MVVDDDAPACRDEFLEPVRHALRHRGGIGQHKDLVAGRRAFDQVVVQQYVEGHVVHQQEAGVGQGLFVHPTHVVALHVEPDARGRGQEGHARPVSLAVEDCGAVRLHETVRDLRDHAQRLRQVRVGVQPRVGEFIQATLVVGEHVGTLRDHQPGRLAGVVRPRREPPPIPAEVVVPEIVVMAGPRHHDPVVGQKKRNRLVDPKSLRTRSGLHVGGVHQPLDVRRAIGPRGDHVQAPVAVPHGREAVGVVERDQVGPMLLPGLGHGEVHRRRALAALPPPLEEAQVRVVVGDDTVLELGCVHLQLAMRRGRIHARSHFARFRRDRQLRQVQADLLPRQTNPIGVRSQRRIDLSAQKEVAKRGELGQRLHPRIGRVSGKVQHLACPGVHPIPLCAVRKHAAQVFACVEVLRAVRVEGEAAVEAQSRRLVEQAHVIRATRRLLGRVNAPPDQPAREAALLAQAGVLDVVPFAGPEDAHPVPHRHPLGVARRRHGQRHSCTPHHAAGAHQPGPHVIVARAQEHRIQLEPRLPVLDRHGLRQPTAHVEVNRIRSGDR